MSIYFRCPKCREYHEDYSGEFAGGDYNDVENYICPDCGTKMQQVEYEEYMKNNY